MSLRSSAPLFALTLLAGCALVYQYGDYGDRGTGGGGAGGASSAATGGATTTSTGPGSTGSSTGSTGTGGATTTSSSTGTGGLPAGKSCNTQSDCASGSCQPTAVGGRICCAATCGTCQVCDFTGATCGPAPKGMPGVGCTAPFACNGNGNCVKGLGATCADPSECLSLTCERVSPPGTGKVCCASACGAPCEACAPSGFCTAFAAGAQDPTCAITMMGSMVGATCSGGGQHCVCDGQANCREINGAACLAPWNCLSGNCVGTVCQ